LQDDEGTDVITTGVAAPAQTDNQFVFSADTQPQQGFSFN
jgi:hypothetical protein